jgi:D-alanine-D-alanine ligase
MKNNITVGILYGGASCEHEVSKMTAKSILKNIDRAKFNVLEIFVDKNGDFNHKNLNKIDIAFLAFHGENYEDGKFQEYLDSRGVKYTGSGAEASQINMDKDLQKIYFAKAGLKTVDYLTIDGDESISETDKRIIETLNYPCFIKPVNAGSSLGISKVSNKSDLKKAIIEANKIGTKIVAEKAVNKPRELEVAVLGNNNVIISDPGEILANGQFYSYEKKYLKPFSTTVNPKSLPKNLSRNIKNWAKKAYKITGCKGYARVDFFLDQKSELYINEINTLPGFTSISMFPKLMEASGINYKDLITKIIELGLEI